MRSHIDFGGKKALVVGAGVSGVAAACLLAEKGIAFDLFDGNEQLSAEELRSLCHVPEGCAAYVGVLPEAAYGGYSYAILSPGVPADLPMVERLRGMGVKIWGEVELAYAFSEGDVLAITGTNGKTTTTALVGEILERYTGDVRVVGNIGVPYTGMASSMTEDTVTVAEISSFQLETIEYFRPRVSAILNITPDHLNRHHTMEAYIAAKERIAENQGRGDTCVLNYEDGVLRGFGERLRGKIQVVFFSSARRLEDGLYFSDGRIYAAKDADARLLCRVDELNLLGRHNYENVMAAAGVAMSYGVPLETVREALLAFTAVEHRIEFVAEIGGVRYYNDSKATNVDAAIQGIRAMDRPTCLIGGGYDKQSEFDEWIAAFDGKVKKLALIGATAGKIADACERNGFRDYVFAGSLREAVDICRDSAAAGDAVLLSPACASWDMFENYEQRGRMFKEMVKDAR